MEWILVKRELKINKIDILQTKHLLLELKNPEK